MFFLLHSIPIFPDCFVLSLFWFLFQSQKRKISQAASYVKCLRIIVFLYKIVGLTFYKIRIASV